MTWDERSFLVDGLRLNIFAGELHHWRAPSPAHWQDLLETMRAAGFTAVSFYFFWGLHQHEPGGRFTFQGIRDVDRLLQLAGDAGLYVIARPGPYVNAEISMGGLPAYLTNCDTALRSTEPDVLAASQAWLSAINQIIARRQVTDGGGPVLLYQVENELFAENRDSAAFLRCLADHARSTGISVPLFHNDYGLGGRFADSTAHHLDFYAYDEYPLGFNAGGERARIKEAEPTLRRIAPRSPHFVTESQGGAFTPWGAEFDATAAYEFTDPAFTRQWGVRNIGNGVTAFNYYMVHGGTNWGWTGSPSSGFTSYDYGAAITEDRRVTEKLAVQKELAGYFRAVPHFASMRPHRAPAVRELDGAPVTGYRRVAGDGEHSASDDGAPCLLGFRLADSEDETDTSFTTALSLGPPDSSVDLHHNPGTAQDGAIFEGDWQVRTDRSASRGVLHRADVGGATVSWSFTGTGVEVITACGTDHGLAQLWIDGADHGMITGHVQTDQNRPTQFVAARVTGLAPVRHTVAITTLGRPAPGGQGTAVVFDEFRPLGDTSASDGESGLDRAQLSWPRIPQQPGTALRLHGRDGLLLTADVVIGGHGLLYTTSQLFGPALHRAAGSVQALIGVTGDPGETVLRYAREPVVEVKGASVRRPVDHVYDARTGELRLNYVHEPQRVDVRVTGVPRTSRGEGVASTLTLAIADRSWARRAWHLPVPGAETIPAAMGDEDHLLIEGTEQAFSACREPGDPTTVRVRVRDTDAATVRIDLPDDVRRVVVNGHEPACTDGVAYGTLPAPRSIRVPDLTFRTAPGAPEAAREFDDSDWTVARATAGTRFQGPGSSGVILDSNHHGFFEGSVWYRGHFVPGHGRELALRANGGTGQPLHGKAPAFAQVWVDGCHAGSVSADGHRHRLVVPPDTLTPGQPAVVAVVVHNLGQNVDWSDDGLSRQNRGLYDVDLPAAGPVTWRVRGARACDADPVRTLYNTGGLDGEFNGWHLAAFDDAAWADAATLEAAEPGVRWYRARFRLDVPADQEASWSVRLTPRGSDGRSVRAPRGRELPVFDDPCQAVLYVNGWNIGAYIGDIGPQSCFRIPAGLLDHQGDNTLAVWVAAKRAGAGPESIRLELTHNATGSLGYLAPLG